MQRILFLVALAIGLLLAYVDSMPNWDDTGIIAGAVLLSCGILGFVAPQRPWLWALAVGLWLPLFHAIESGNLASLLALVFAFGGAYAGMLCRWMVGMSRTSKPA